MKKNFKVHSTKRLPCKVEFYVRTDKGINTGKLILGYSEGDLIRNITFNKNQWLSKPYIKFTTEKRKNEHHIEMIGKLDKEAMVIFTITDGNGIVIKTN